MGCSSSAMGGPEVWTEKCGVASSASERQAECESKYASLQREAPCVSHDDEGKEEEGREPWTGQGGSGHSKDTWVPGQGRTCGSQCVSGIRGLVGLANLGNTCFLNSAVQCLSSTVPLTDYFLRRSWKDEVNRANPLGMKGEIAESYGELVQRLWAEDRGRGEGFAVSPCTFKARVGRFAPQFSGFEQHDAQEFLAFLLDGLHEDLNRVVDKRYVPDPDANGMPDELVAAMAWQSYLRRNKSIIVDLFQGQLRSVLRCCTCGHQSVKFDPFMYLSLPLPDAKEGPVSLADCLDEFTRVEQLTGTERWHCTKCRTFRDATKKLDLWKVPPVLIVHLKRFKYDARGNRRKIDGAVQFPVAGWDLDGHIRSQDANARRRRRCDSSGGGRITDGGVEGKTTREEPARGVGGGGATTHGCGPEQRQQIQPLCDGLPPRDSTLWPLHRDLPGC